jgi:hypothetical protein
MSKLPCFWAGNGIPLHLKIFGKDFAPLKFLLMESAK